VKKEKLIAAAVVLAVVFGFLRCMDIWIQPGENGWGGTNGFDAGVGGNEADAGGDGGDAGHGGNAGSSGAGGSVTHACGDGVCDGSEDIGDCPGDCDHDLVVIVEQALAPILAGSLVQYVDDLAAEGSRARVEAWEPGRVQELKALLFDQVDRYGVEGAFLIGNLPAAFFEHRVICLAWDRLGQCVMYEYEEFPTDVYLQDRNATWDDANNNGKYDAHGELELEIFVSRLQTLPDPVKCETSQLFPECPTDYDPARAYYASEECLQECPSRLRTQVWPDLGYQEVECCGPYFLLRYFERLHQYKSEGALVDRLAMLFADDDFEHMVFPSGLETLYRNVEVLADGGLTTKDMYVDRLTGGGVELVHHLLHSTVQNLYFYECMAWIPGEDPPACSSWSSEHLHRTQISAGPFEPSYNLAVSFVNMYNCHASRFTEPNLAMSFTLQTNYGLATVGNTRKGGMTDATLFHRGLVEGKSWGESYRRWYNEIGKYDDRWYLGIVLTGDPMLTIPLEPGEARALSPPASVSPPIETPPELTATDPPGTFEDYKRRNPQFFRE
jgi:hypothetical protein